MNFNLYSIDCVHYAPKDHHRAISHYLIAETKEDVFAYMMEKYWSDKEWDEFEKESVLENQGEWEFEVYDLYYGATQRGWTLIKENLSSSEIEVLQNTEVARVV